MFRRHLISIALLIAGLVTACITFGTTESQAPPNLILAKQELIKYHDSGEYNQQIAKQIRKGMYYLRFRINQNAQLRKPRKLAIVFDIDETTLSNYQHMLENNFGGNKQAIMKDIAKGDDPAIHASRAMYDYAKRHDVAIFFVTGRSEKLRDITVANLHKVGYDGWKHLYMKPASYAQQSIVPFKTKMRKKIVGQGYDIVLDVGDQESDLKGGYADMTVKLPNPFYFVA